MHIIYKKNNKHKNQPTLVAVRSAPKSSSARRGQYVDG